MATKRNRSGQFVKGRRRASPKRRTTAKRRTTSRRSTTRRKGTGVATKRKAPTRRRRRATSGKLLSKTTIQQAAYQAGGAIAAGIITKKLADTGMFKSMTSPWAGVAIQAGVGVGVGYAIGKFTKNRGMGTAVAVGALSAAMLNAARIASKGQIPGLEGGLGNVFDDGVFADFELAGVPSLGDGGLDDLADDDLASLDGLLAAA